MTPEESEKIEWRMLIEMAARYGKLQERTAARRAEEKRAGFRRARAALAKGARHEKD